MVQYIRPMPHGEQKSKKDRFLLCLMHKVKKIAEKACNFC